MTIRNIRKNFLIAIVSSSLLVGAVIAIPFVANAQNGSSEKIISLDDPTNAIEEDKQNSETKQRAFTPGGWGGPALPHRG